MPGPPNFQPIRLLDLGCGCKFSYWMTNSVVPDQLVSSDEANWSGYTPFTKEWHIQRCGISGTSRTGLFIFIHWDPCHWLTSHFIVRKPIVTLLTFLVFFCTCFIPHSFYYCHVFIYHTMCFSFFSTFYTLPNDSGGILWFHVRGPCVCLYVHLSSVCPYLSSGW